MMTAPQAISLGLIFGIVVLMVWGRLRYDLVAGLALIMAVASGVVPAKDAFKGFSDDIVIIVGSALVVSAGIARSGVFETALKFLSPYLRSTQAQVAALVLAVGIMSSLIKNIGALAMMIPIAFRFARASGKSASVFLMPMAFASLLGGLVTLIGTSPNVVVSRVRAEITGTPYSMFDFAYVGFWLALAGLAFLCFGYRLLPRDRRGSASLAEALVIDQYVTEAAVTPETQAAGRTISDLLSRAEAGVSISAIIRNKRSIVPFPDTVLKVGDSVVLAGDQAALHRLVKETGLFLDGHDRPTTPAEPLEEVVAIEAIVTANSPLIGSGAKLADLHARFGVNLLAISRAGAKSRERLRDISLRTGDVVVLQGPENSMPGRLAELGLLPLVERAVMLGDRRRSWLAPLILAAAIVALAGNWVSVPMAFFSAAVLMVVTGALPPKEAYESVEWPILVMLGALIPVSDALEKTGATGILVSGLSAIAGNIPDLGVVALMILTAMAVTPFLNNAATVLVVAPIGAKLALSMGYKPDAFLMAVAIGAACDFLTPIGHQCNTLVMGPGGYRFTDYMRLGAPLSLMVLVLGPPLILLAWPLR